MSVDFLDSNVFIYLFDSTDERKCGIASRLVESAIETDRGCISFQVVQETLRVITGKLAKPATAALANEFFEYSLMPLWRIMPSRALYVEALRIQQRWKFAFYDSLIVAAALEAGCKRLLSEDLQHDQRVEGLRIENPFKPA
jgi:predicted nucleic acid-binding protein